MTSQASLDHYTLVPDVFQKFVAAHTQIGETGLEPKLRHLIDLRASQINKCAFCVKMHTEEAKKDGETSERIERLTVWRHVADYSPAERAALAWTEALTELDPKTDYAALRADLRACFEDREISAITTAVSMINLWNRIQVSNH
ncbi:carboxymuconolactone decarboxylase family protein [Roseibium sp. RKSG952]|uniref:carboxymuconolactone decarboxylase family protein n=1 Tax=Roseibium sp. RKSG952 TaxID=2529384 RepID=UPI0012BD4D77|nr:carboxymuconolactone decarboxylase family protein [Roseibium sp. RKSG952]MTH98867.1 carboxymuconolactone decarboxylase family protein [Roseibium sp. RKSG952]